MFAGARYIAAAMICVAFGSACFAQSSNVSTARELVTTMRFADQFRVMLPAMLQSIKPAIVQGRSDVALIYDANIPLLMDAMSAKLDGLTDNMAAIYAENFTETELRDLIAFYKTPTGQKLLQKTPLLAQQTMAAGQTFGATAAREAQRVMLERAQKNVH